MKYKIWIIAVTTRGRSSPPDHPPLVYTDFDKARRAYWHLCDSNVPVNRNRPHRQEHPKTRAIYRWEPVVITDPVALLGHEPLPVPSAWAQPLSSFAVYSDSALTQQAHVPLNVHPEAIVRENSVVSTEEEADSGRG